MSDKIGKNYYLAAVKDGRVVASYYARSLAAVASVMVRHPGCEVEAYSVSEYGFAFGDAPVIKVDGVPMVRGVRCRETGETWASVKECCESVGLPLKAVYSGLRRHTRVYGHTYEPYDPAADDTKTSNEEQNG